MQSVRKVTEQVYWIGANDRRISRFENMFPLPNGVAYNSYLVLDEKTAILDTVDSSVSAQYLENVAHVLNGRTLDYLVINHMEPDHCANIEALVRRYPDVRVVGNKKTFQFFSQYYNTDIAGNQLEVCEGQELPLGRTALRFYMAPMVHWPEVMMTYEATNKILFSADAFGAFGALSGNLFADEMDVENLFLDEARRYYANIVGRFGAQVQAVLNKLKSVPVRVICPLHGPVWRENLWYLLEKYDRWSRYIPEKRGVVLFYASMYGNTENAMLALADKLGERGVTDMRMYDVSNTHASYIIADVFKYSHFVIGSPTYNMSLYYGMDAVLHEMAVLNIQNRSAAVIGNHTWASAAKKAMEERLNAMKDITILGTLDIRSSLKSGADLDPMADAIA
ncbi:MAG TPA: FprA family A-type flavoprotein, partial [Feifaniaceae bacterium]|nr:FprA family A-type flavoprotein [Feifaniaceae bacterium]